MKIQHKNKHLIPLLCLIGLSFSQSISAQDSAATHRLEIVMNITNALSRFSGNGAKNITEDPYLLALKLISKNNKRAWRIGINESYIAQNSDLGFGQRKSKEFYISPIFGHEWRMKLSKSFTFYSGLDFRMGFRDNTVKNLDSQFRLTSFISSSERSYGFGPFCGFVWQINPRVALLTEANFYANYLYTKRYTDDGVSKTILENSQKWVFTPVIPTSLYISIRL